MESGNITFAEWLFQICDDFTMYGKLHLPPDIEACTQPTDLIHFAYPSPVFANASNNITSFANRYILAFHNNTVNKFNLIILEQVLDIIQVINTFDAYDVDEEHSNFAVLSAEYLQSLDYGRHSLSCLKLKVGHPTMLLWNLYLIEGLYNGT